MKLLHTVGYRVKISNLKALLKEIGFNWNGASCSIAQLIDRLKVYTKEPNIDQVEGLLNAEKQAVKPKTLKGIPQDQETLHKIMKKKGENALSMLSQVLYNHDKFNLFELFREFSKIKGTNVQVVSLESFELLVKKHADGLITPV